MPGHKIKQRLLATESNRFDGSVGGYAIQVQFCGWPEKIAPGPLTDKGEGKVQRDAPKIQRGLLSVARRYLLPDRSHPRSVEHRFDHGFTTHA